MTSQGVLCGVPGDLVRGEAIGHQHDKTGGFPRFPGASAPCTIPQCATCNNDMHLVAQVYAPREDEVDRVVHVFGCCQQGCGRDASCWSAWCTRAQQPQEAEPSVPSTSPTVTTDWATAADTWGAGSATDDDDVAALSAALQGLNYNSAPLVTSSAPPDTPAAGASHVFNTAAPCLAEFYILFEPEPSRKAHRPGWDAGADSGQHLAQLIRSYEAEDAAAGSDAQDAGWSGEGYEEDAARGADAAYLKFAKQLALVPQQCIRYYDRSGGTESQQVLWPVQPSPELGACQRCGAARVAEVQLMAPLIHMLHEAAGWLAEEGVPKSRVLVPPESWEWLTVLVAVCSADCGAASGDGLVWTQEHVFVQNE